MPFALLVGTAVSRQAKMDVSKRSLGVGHLCILFTALPTESTCSHHQTVFIVFDHSGFYYILKLRLLADDAISKLYSILKVLLGIGVAVCPDCGHSGVTPSEDRCF